MNEKIIRDVLDNRASTMDADAVAAWFATPEGQQELGRLLDERFDELENRSQPLAREIPSEAIYRSIDREIQRSKWRHWVLRAAAVVIPLLIVVAGGVYLDRQFGGALFAPTTFVEQVADRGERIRIAFQDGTTVFLNAGSTIEYPKWFGWRERSVTLSGEAYFEVASESRRPFVVHFRDGAVKVLGTSFDVKAYPEDPEVVVALDQGSVEFSTAELSRRLVPSDRLIYDRASRQVRIEQNVQTAEFSRWREDELIFRGASFREVAAVLSRRYDVDFLIEDERVNEFRYTFTASHASLETILQDMEYIAPVRFIRDGGQITVCSSEKK